MTGILRRRRRMWPRRTWRPSEATPNAEITWSYTYLGQKLTGALCARPGGGDLYVPMYVTKVTWQPRTC
ncbi:hypothetical protein AB0B85_20130 [Micromonospora sp. NPDC049044]|uniref:hypothetical protein n=1 Tax=unclassified Micromonospora TaxID=2617518 RepID=UPI0033EE1010